MNRQFSSIGALGKTFDQLSRIEKRADRYARRTVTKIVVLAVQNRLGEKDALLPYLKPATQRERVRLGFTPDDTLERSGALKRSIEDGEIGPRESGVGTALPYALFHEMGGAIPGKPPRRSFLASTVRENDRKLFLEYVEALIRALNV